MKNNIKKITVSTIVALTLIGGYEVTQKLVNSPVAHIDPPNSVTQLLRIDPPNVQLAMIDPPN